MSDAELDPFRDDLADGKRERPVARDHWTYEKPHWETAHVERVDRIGAFPNAPQSDERAEEAIRVDLDGHGHPGASMHDSGDNVQVSVWLTPETATALVDDLVDELDRVGVDR